MRRSTGLYRPRGDTLCRLTKYLILLLAFAGCTARHPPATVLPAAPVDPSKLDAIEPLIEKAIAERKLPGAVVLVGLGDRTLYHKAIGQRALVPSPEPMTLDTIFDLASLTKVVATTTSVMILIEEGKIGLNDRVCGLHSRVSSATARATSRSAIC